VVEKPAIELGRNCVKRLRLDESSHSGGPVPRGELTL
jgi:hypothetical protein